MSTDFAYTSYGETPEGGIPAVAKQVIVKGGAGVANKNVVTPQGVATQITSEESEFLMLDPTFQKHAERGFVALRDKKADPEVVASDMGPLDKSSPLTDSDFSDEKVPTVGKL